MGLATIGATNISKNYPLYPISVVADTDCCAVIAILLAIILHFYKAELCHLALYF